MNVRATLICLVVCLVSTRAFKVRRAIRDYQAGCGPLTALENKRSPCSLAALVPSNARDIGDGRDITQH